MIASGTLTDDLVYRKASKPSQLGVFIYAHARAHMYNNIFSKVPCLYTDTDSALLYEEDYDELLK